MSRRTLIPLVALGALAIVAVPPASAKHKKPISKTYTAQALPPDPSHAVNGEGICRTTLDQAQHVHEFKAPEAGTIEILMNGFQGDWDLALRNDKDQHLADSAQQITEPLDRPEKIKYKLKKATGLRIVACNFSGGPQATVKYTFTYAR